jgi:hypothetical protein
MSADLLHQRVDHTTCARCRKKFKAGDRVLAAMIILDPDTRDPISKMRSAQMSNDFELVHAACADPTLEGGKVILLA